MMEKESKRQGGRNRMFKTEKYKPRHKAFRFTAALLLVFLLLTGCAEKSQTDQPKDNTAGKIADFFPALENTKYIYEGAGNEFAGYDAYIDYASGDKVQQRIENGGTVMARVYEIKDGKLTLKLSKGEVYYRDNLLDRKGDTEEVMLMEPLAKGTSWTLKDGSKRTITGTNTVIATPMGSYPCIEVTTENSDGSTSAQYYAKDVGLVKNVFSSGGEEVTSTLKSIEKDAARTQMIRLYFPDVKSGRIYYEEREVTFYTNDFTGKVFEAACRNAIKEGTGKTLSGEMLIKGLTLGDDGTVRADFSASLTAETDAVPDYEVLILQCIADTLGYYFNSDRVILTVEGKPYQSKQVNMTEGQAIPVKLDGITEKSMSEIY
jgi:hypothetical protein